MKIQYVRINEIGMALQNVNEWQAVLIGFGGGLEPNSSLSWVRMTTAPIHNLGFSREAPEPYEQELDKLMDEAAGSYDFHEAKTLYIKIQQLITEHLPMIFTVTRQFIYVCKAAMGNNDHFNASTGGILVRGGTSGQPSLSPIIWWKDEPRRNEPLDK
jgi:ABC-type transport system substrate-binding protein